MTNATSSNQQSVNNISNDNEYQNEDGESDDDDDEKNDNDEAHDDNEKNDNNEEEFDVESILRVRFNKARNCRQFLCRFVTIDGDEPPPDWWCDEDDIPRCRTMIDKFLFYMKKRSKQIFGNVKYQGLARDDNGAAPLNLLP